MKKLLLLCACLTISLVSFSQKAVNDSIEQLNRLKKIIERDKQIAYQTGNVDVNSEIKLAVPKGYKFMPKADAEYVVFDLWRNPRQDNLVGMVVDENYTIANPYAWAFVVTHENSGYVKDEDADDIDYDEMMQTMQKEEVGENEERTKQGYPAIHIVGWAAKPYYDKKNNILHWAKALTFGDQADTTLNYDVRILGRKGVLSLNAVGMTNQLPEITKHIPDIVHIAKFKEGSRYMDFDPSIDKVAAYSIGGLIAGKLLAKVGILALLLKNIKLIIIGLVAFFSRFGKKILAIFSGNKGQRLQPEAENPSDEPV